MEIVCFFSSLICLKKKYPLWLRAFFMFEMKFFHAMVSVTFVCMTTRGGCVFIFCSLSFSPILPPVVFWFVVCWNSKRMLKKIILFWIDFQNAAWNIHSKIDLRFQLDFVLREKCRKIAHAVVLIFFHLLLKIDSRLGFGIVRLEYESGCLPTRKKEPGRRNRELFSMSGSTWNRIVACLLCFRQTRDSCGHAFAVAMNANERN